MSRQYSGVVQLNPNILNRRHDQEFYIVHPIQLCMQKYDMLPLKVSLEGQQKVVVPGELTIYGKKRETICFYGRKVKDTDKY